ncbi:hypothetical protein ColLi_10531 [Colletotrichum liriopes]|uniref:C2H2-type domain-containing protein n=1 Tax=Colletotrichum liriopes TaxID=708192 RepID=A0AA37GUU8_9PEZI|nr:hypothetical protein ColLi_10531 [Colletotrichum liriopes]
MASNAQVAPSLGPPHPHASNPAQDLVASTTPAANNALRNVSPSSLSSAGEASGRKMKRTGAAKPLVKPSPHGQAPPPWATSLLGGRGSIGFTATPSSAPAQPNFALDVTTDMGLADRPSGLDTPDNSRPRSPKPSQVVSDIVQTEPEDPLAIKPEAPSPEETTDSDMAGKKKTLAGHAKIQALQESWESGGIASGSSGIADSTPGAETTHRGKDWLGGDSVMDNKTASRKRSPPGTLTGNETKRRMTAIPLPGVPTKASSEGISTPAPVATELDLLNAVSAGRAERLKSTFLGSTEGTNVPPPSTSKPSFDPTAREAQIIDISDEETEDENETDAGEDATDDDETTEGRESNISGPRPAPTTTQTDNPFSQGLLELSVTKGADSRGYLQWRTSQGIESSCGTILPTNYQLHPDPDYPLICPVRNCRTIFPKMNSLGAHFCAKHRSSKFNDNLDGTLSFVDYYKKAGAKYSPPIVVSQNPLRGDEPRMPEPATAAAKAAASQPLSAVPMPVPKRFIVPNLRVTKARKYSPSRDLPPDNSQPTQSASSSQPNRTVLDSTDLLTYLSSHLSPAYKLPKERPDIKALLKLPRKRLLPQPWRTKYSGVGHLAPLAAVALLVYLTGDEAPMACSPCMIMADAAPPFLKEIGNKACAGCQWRSNFRREKSNCSFLSTAPPATHAAPPLAAPSPPLSADAAADAYPLPYSAAQEPQSPPASRSSYLPPARPSAPNAHNSKTSPPDSHPRRVTRHSLAASKVVVEPSSSHAAASAVASLTGNLVPPHLLEMEDWEVAPGRLRDERGESPTNVAFSNSYLTTNQAVTVSEDISFNVIVIKPGDSHQWPAEAEKVRICSLAAGKLKVKLDNTEPFQMGPNGMFKLRSGMACTVENRLYIDAVIHVTTVSQF